MLRSDDLLTTPNEEEFHRQVDTFRPSLNEWDTLPEFRIRHARDPVEAVFNGLRSGFLSVTRRNISLERSHDISYNFHMEIANLQEDLKVTNEFLAAERELNKRLWIDLETAISRERAAGSAYKVLKEKLQNILIENERLKVDNELLRSELFESKLRFGKTLKLEDCEVNSASKLLYRGSSQSSQASDGSERPPCAKSLRNFGQIRDDAERIWCLEQQVMSLTREKKQLMTHLHWLSRHRSAEQARPDSGYEDHLERVQKVSLEEGNGTPYDSQLSQASSNGSSLVRSNRIEVFSREGSMDVALPNKDRNLRGEQHLELFNGAANQRGGATKAEDVNPRNLLSRIKKLKADMLNVKRIAAKNNDLCDVIFQLSFQNLRHPNEPKSYSNWSSYDDDKMLSWNSLEKSHDNVNWQPGPRHGYRSLEFYPQGNKDSDNDPAITYDLWAKKKSSISSPELFPAKRMTLDEYMFHISQAASMKVNGDGHPSLNRSLSDRQRGSSLKPYYGRDSLGKVAMDRPVFSTLTSSDETETQIGCDDSHVDDDIDNEDHDDDDHEEFTSMQFTSMGHVVSQPRIEDEFAGLRSGLSGSSPRISYPENLIS